MYKLHEGDLFVQLAIHGEQAEFIYDAGRAVPIQNGNSRISVSDHEQIVGMVERFLVVAKDKLEEEKKIRVLGIKRVL